jgi:hypothetical protein
MFEKVQEFINERESLVFMLEEWGPGPLWMVCTAVWGVCSVPAFFIALITGPFWPEMLSLYLMVGIIVLGLLYSIESLYWRPIAWAFRTLIYPEAGYATKQDRMCKLCKHGYRFMDPCPSCPR